MLVLIKEIMQFVENNIIQRRTILEKYFQTNAYNSK